MHTFKYSIAGFILILLLFPIVVSAVSLDDLLPRAGQFIGRPGTSQEGKIDLPGGGGQSFRDEIIPASITIMLSLAGSIAFIVFTVAGIMLIVSQGNEELHTKVKNIFIYAVIGLTLIALSYAIVYGIFTLRFQEGPA